MTWQDDDSMTDCAKAYLAEYQTLPKSREEQDRYSAFRLGFEAGQKYGRRKALRDAAWLLTVQADA